MTKSTASEQQLISVIIPVYNAIPFVAQCLQSVQNQRYVDNLEILIVDDGSTDGSGDICRSLSANDSRVTVLHQKNAGQGAARNAALDMASGSYIAFADADDWMELDMLYCLMQILQHNNADMAVCAYTQRKGRKAIVKDRAPVSLLPGLKAMLPLFEANWLNNFVWNKLFCRELFEHIRFPVDCRFEEIPVMYRLIEKSRFVAFTPYPAYNYRIHPDSTTGMRNIAIELDACENHIVRYHDIACRHPKMESALWKPLTHCLMHTLLVGIFNSPNARGKCLHRRERIAVFLRERQAHRGKTLSTPERWVCRLACYNALWADALVAVYAVINKLLCRLKRTCEQLRSCKAKSHTVVEDLKK